MESTLALEVLDGPMDGLRSCIRQNAAAVQIGRQVGNHLTLPFDMTISRWHAMVKKEGREHYLIDEKSVSGTWVEGKRIEKLKIEPGTLFLAGGTIIEVIELPVSQDSIAFKEEYLDNPLEIYEFENTLKEIWVSLRQEREYIDISSVFQMSAFQRLKKLSRYDGIKNLSRPDSRQVISSWMGQCDIHPRYRFFHQDQCITPPRMWHILDDASDGNKRPISLIRFIEAVLSEGRSTAARALKRDTAFIQALKNKFSTPHKKNKPSQSPVGDANRLDPLKPLLADALIQIETIISGFIEDAMSSGLAKGESLSSQRGLNFETPMDTTEQSDLSDRLKRLEKNLVAVLAAHRDALTLFEKELKRRIYHVLENQDNKGLFTGLSSSDSAVSNAVKRVLKDVELEGLSDQIVRHTIKRKILS